MKKKLTVHLMGGLGNQMFQYAAGRALAHKSSAHLFLDNSTGFKLDKIYKRNYELDTMPINAEIANFWKTVPFWTEKIWSKLLKTNKQRAINKRICTTVIKEPQASYLSEVGEFEINGNVWIYGYWQSESYFSDISNLIKLELTPPVPKEKQFQDCAELMKGCNSIAIGVRLFEEVPVVTQGSIEGVTPISFYNKATQELIKSINNPVFFVFCTSNSQKLSQLDLPGPVYYITHENGFVGAVHSLWLISHCKHHIIANSSFYWWGAWLAESRYGFSKIIASPLFPNKDTIPKRWISQGY